MTSIGEQIMTARKAKGLTQEALAEMLNVSRSTVANWENGRRIPDGEMLLRVAKTLEYSFETESSIQQDAVNNEENQYTETIDENVHDQTDDTDVVAESPTQSPIKQRRIQPKMIYQCLAAVGMIVLLVVAFFVLRAKNAPAYKDETGTVYTIAQFQQPVANEQGKAYLRLEPTVQVTEGENYNYWMYGFNMYEENGIACRVNRVEEFVFAESGKLVHRTYGAGDIQAYGTSLDIAARGEWWFGGGFPVQAIRGVGIKVSCTDEHDEQLSFVSYLPLSEK